MNRTTHTSHRAPTEPHTRHRTPLATCDTTTAQLAPAPDVKLRALYSPEHAAAYLDISRSQLYRMLAAGRLTGFRLGRLRRFTRTELDALAAAIAGEGGDAA